MARIPLLRRVSLGAGTISDQNTLFIPAGATCIILNPQTLTVDVQLAFNRDDVNTTGRFFTLQDGQPMELKTVSLEDTFPDLTITMFAASAVDVDVLWW